MLIRKAATHCKDMLTKCYSRLNFDGFCTLSVIIFLVFLSSRYALKRDLISISQSEVKTTNSYKVKKSASFQECEPPVGAEKVSISSSE